MTRGLQHLPIDPTPTRLRAMIEAFIWGAVAASPLLIGALVAYVATPSKTVIAVVMALGAGLLIGSVAFELIDEALKTTDVALVGLFTLIGAAAFTGGDRLLESQGGGDRKDADGAQESGSPLAIVFGSVLDGIPESFVLGLTVLQGGVSVAHSKCMTCRARVWRDGTAAEPLDDLCPGCGGPPARPPPPCGCAAGAGCVLQLAITNAARFGSPPACTPGTSSAASAPLSASCSSEPSAWARRPVE